MGMEPIPNQSDQRNRHTAANPLGLSISIQPEDVERPELSQPLNKDTANLPILAELIGVVQIHY